MCYYQYYALDLKCCTHDLIKIIATPIHLRQYPPRGLLAVIGAACHLHFGLIEGLHGD